MYKKKVAIFTMNLSAYMTSVCAQSDTSTVSVSHYRRRNNKELFYLPVNKFNVIHLPLPILPKTASAI